MSLNTSIVSAMGADPDILALIGTRLFLLRIPQGALAGPAVSFVTTGEIQKHAHGSLSVRKDAELTLHLWAASSMAVENLKQALITFWNAYDGPLGTVYVSNCTLSDVGFSYETETALYHSVLIANLQIRNI